MRLIQSIRKDTQPVRTAMSVGNTLIFLLYLITAASLILWLQKTISGLVCVILMAPGIICYMVRYLLESFESYWDRRDEECDPYDATSAPHNPNYSSTSSAPPSWIARIAWLIFWLVISILLLRSFPRIIH